MAVEWLKGLIGGGKIEGVTRGKIIQDLWCMVTISPGLSNATFIHTSRLV